MPTENEGKTEEEEPQKSSMEILSELFGSFDAEPPVIIKKEKSDERKHKKSKKKHKHKEKKHKKKSKKRKRSDSCNSSDNSAVDITGILIKKEDCDVSEPENLDDKAEKCPSIYDAAILAIKEKEMTKIEENSSETKVVEKRSKESRHKKKRRRSKSRDDQKRGRGQRSKSRSKSAEARRPKRKREKSRPRSSSRDKSSKKDHEKRRAHDDFYSKDDKHSKANYRSHSEKEKRFRSEEVPPSSSHIDKKKLLEIARKNAIQMMKSGSLPGVLSLGPQAQEKVIAAIKSGGKTVEELTDFCKSLSKKEELGELSSVSEENDSDTDSEKQFHHPFLIKDRPVSITMNIKNSIPLPLKNSQERASELRIQFPVSSGQQHRKTENEWVPVSPKKTEGTVQTATTTITTSAAATTTVVKQTQPKVIAAQPPVVAESSETDSDAPSVFSTDTKSEQNIDIAAIVTQRLSAMRKLQENPHDVQALNSMYKAQKEMNSWAESKQQIGQFTGSTGAQILSQAELSSGYQAWARKLQTAAPVSGGMGMHLLQKMGWRPGEGLGKEKTGTLEPLLLEVKLDKKGIVAREDHQKRRNLKNAPKVPAQVLQGKHPVSLLGEYACKNKLGIPQYDLCFECGPDHKKNFLFRVILNNTEYKPQIASPNKKEAKANAALVCLQQLGILPAQPLVQSSQPVPQQPIMPTQPPMAQQLLMPQQAIISQQSIVPQ